MPSQAAFAWSAAHPRNYSLWNIDELPDGHRTSADVELDARNTFAAAQRAVDRINFGAAPDWLRLGERPRAAALKRRHESLLYAGNRLVELRRLIAFEHPRALHAQSDAIDRLIGRFNDSAIRFNRLSSIFGSGLPMLDAIPNLKKELPAANIAETSEPTPLNLAGKTLVGTVERAEVGLVFDERAFRVTGDLQDSGVWKLNASGVSLETRNSVYRGVVTGYFAPDRIQGFRYHKERQKIEAFSLRVQQTGDFTGRWRLVELRYPDRDEQMDEKKSWRVILTHDPARLTEATIEDLEGNEISRMRIPEGRFGWEGDRLTFTSVNSHDPNGGLLEAAAQSVWRRMPP